MLNMEHGKYIFAQLWRYLLLLPNNAKVSQPTANNQISTSLVPGG